MPLGMLPYLAYYSLKCKINSLGVKAKGGVVK
jgi:hypothetical protein